jgi:mycothiol synthase
MTTEVEPELTLVAVDGAPDIPGLRFRRATAADWGGLAELVNRARAADGVDEVHTAESWAAEYPESEMFQLTRDVLIAEVDGRIVAQATGYLTTRDGAVVAESSGAVLPELRRRGLGTALYLATHERLARQAADDARPGPRERRAYALDDEVADRAMLDANGYVAIRFGFEMRRFLTGPLPEHALPPGIELRPVTEEQHRAIFEADAEAFRDHWGHREPDESDYVAKFTGPDTDTSLWCVAWAGDEVVGSVQNYVFADENVALGIARGWLDHVSVRRAWRGRGVAKALCAASFRVLRDRGITEAWLGVDAGNPTGALALYEGLGFNVVRRWQAFGRPMDRPAWPAWRSGAGSADGADPRAADPRAADHGADRGGHDARDARATDNRSDLEADDAPDAGAAHRGDAGAASRA